MKTLSEIKNKTQTGSHLLLNLLLEHEVNVVFGYPGGAIMPFYDALYDYKDQLNHILVRHEQAAIHAAQGYARLTGKPGICITTSGPGATNIVTGLADAFMDGTPLVCIAGQVPSKFLGMDAFQEVDIMNMTLPVTKWSYQITNSGELNYAVDKAFEVALSGRPGPVLLDLSKNVQTEVLKYWAKTERNKLLTATRKQIDEAALTQAAALLNNAKRPYVLIGQGILQSGASDLLLDFLNKTGFPVASTLLGLSALPVNHPQYVGMLGMHGNYAANLNINNCDVILGLGLRFDDRVTGDVSRFAKQAKIIHVDIDPTQLHKVVKTEIAVESDAALFLKKITPLIKKKNHEDWHNSFKKLHRLEVEKVYRKEFDNNSGELKMAEIVKTVSDKVNGNAYVLADVGQHQMVAARYFQFSSDSRFVTSGGAGTMGYALPAAMGACLANVSNSKPVIVFVGDGAFQMNIQELATIAQYNLAVKVVVLNNNFLGMVRQWQELFFESRYSFVEMENPDFAAIANAYGIRSKSINNKSELQNAIDEMFSDNNPYVLVANVEKQENVFPMIPSGESVSNMRLE